MSFVSIHFWNLWATNLILEACIIDDTCFVRRKSGCLLPMHGFWRILGWGCSKKTAERAKKPFQAEFSQQGSCSWHADCTSKKHGSKIHTEEAAKYIRKLPFCLKQPTWRIKLSARNGLIPLNKKSDKNPCDFLSEAQTPIFWCPWLLPGEFFYNLLRFYFRKTFFFPQVCRVFFWF